MLAAIVALAGLAYWDEQREFASALDDFAREQALVASSLAADVSSRLGTARRDALRLAGNPDDGGRASLLEGYLGFAVHPPGEAAASGGRDVIDLKVRTPDAREVDLFVNAATLLEGLGRLERPGSALVLLLAPDGSSFRTTDGRMLDSAPIKAALDSGATSVWLGRRDAASLGLSPRRAAAGIARIDAGALGHWAVALVSSAEHERDRETRAQIRLALSTFVAAVLVLGLGTVVLRKQRKELLLSRELAISDLERARDAELAKASRVATLGTLAMGIAHEVSTPLGVIAGRAEQLATRVSDERGARAVKAITDEADRIRRVVRGFLDLARGDAPTLGLADPRAILRTAVGMVEHRFAAAGVGVELAVDTEITSIHCDRAMLEQAIVNLLLNACDASTRGTRVVVGIHGDGDRAAFTVRDEGSGIPPEIAARVTEPFFTTKAEGKGSGLGLAIASEIVKLHHGELVLRAASPRGTIASLLVPIRGELRDAA